MRRQNDSARPAFTLIELLVVIAVIALIAALSVLVVPNLIKVERAGRGASTLQSGLFIAKQQGLRDRVPFGVRLLVDTDGYVRRFQYIHQPDDFTGGTATVGASSPSGSGLPYTTTVLLSRDPTGGLSNPAQYLVQVNDFLQVQTGQPMPIVAVNPTSVTVQSAAPLTPLVTTDYRIIRAPRPYSGEEIVEFPEGVAVDLARSSPPNVTDILFSPGGPVLGQASVNGKIMLWVRDLDTNPATTEDQSLVVAYTRSSRIASFPVDVGSANPYSFVQQSPRGNGQ